MRHVGLALVATLLVAGCASVRQHEVARPSSPSSVRPARVEPDTIERTSPVLAEALARSKADPTAENRTRAADAYRAAGILDQAYEQYLQASKLDPRNAAAWDGMARIWRDWGYPSLALPDASRAVFFAAGSAAAHNTLGTILQSLGKPREARVEFGRALALDPQAAYALNNLCYSWVSEGNGAAAGDACRQALALAPDLTPARNNLALSYTLQGDLVGAQREFSVAGSPAATAYNLGVVHMAQGRFRAAAAAFDRAASLQPGLSLAIARARQARRLADANPGTEDDDGLR